VNGNFLNTPDTVIMVNDVYKFFKTVKAVNGVSLNIPKGEFVALLGPNGAGKTTLVEMIEGIQKPDKGEIFIMGKKWKGNEDEIHRVIGISLQETRFIDILTVEETLKLFASFYQIDNKRVDEIIGIIDLEEKRKSYVEHLSNGQRQKLTVGISLLNKPEILLLDEPTSGLDPNARKEIWSILLKLKEESNTSLILTTHNMEEAEWLCDYIIIIDKGKIIKEGTRGELLTDNQKVIEFTLNGNQQMEKIFGNNSPFKIKWDNVKEKGVVTIKNPETELQEFLNYLKEKNLQLKNFDSRRKTLNDLFTSLTGRHLDE